MIELRWLIDPHSKDRVLQFRTQVMQIGNGYRRVGAGDGNTYVISEYQRPMGMTWTEWQAVPEVIAQPSDIEGSGK